MGCDFPGLNSEKENKPEDTKNKLSENWSSTRSFLQENSVTPSFLSAESSQTEKSNAISENSDDLKEPQLLLADQEDGTAATFAKSDLLTSEDLPLRVNVGGFSFQDAQGFEWLSDRYFSELRHGFFLDFEPIEATEDDRLYQSERFAKNLNYAIPLENGRYRVVLHFAEIWADKKEMRVFSGLLEDDLAFHQMDLFALHGSHRATQIERIVDVVDEELNIDLWATMNNAKLSGYEVHFVKSFEGDSAGTVLEDDGQKPIRINVGGGRFLDEDGNLFEEDQFFYDSEEAPTKIYRKNVMIEGTEQDHLYQTERFAKELNYQFPVANGDYQVKLHFAEIWTEQADKRVFDVVLEGNKVIEDLDLVKQYGYAVAKVSSFDVTVGDGELNLEMLAATNNAKLSGIEILPLSSQKRKILIFTKTAGFRHRSIDNGIAAIQAKAEENDVNWVQSEDSSLFQDSSLQEFDAIVLLSTTGDYLNESEQAALQRYIRSGRGVAGVHAATDAEYDWQWYNELLGASFNRHPKPQRATLIVQRPENRATQFLPATWERTDEWYNFAPNPRDNQVDVLITIDESTYDPGVNAMGADHPIAWCKHFQGGRSFYTASGHTPQSFSEALFVEHIWQGIEFAMGGTRFECNPNL